MAFSGKTTHHLIQPHPSNGMPCVSGEADLSKPTINELLEFLSTAPADVWPCAPKTFIPTIQLPGGGSTTDLAEYIASGPPAGSLGPPPDDGIMEAESTPHAGMITDITALPEPGAASAPAVNFGAGGIRKATAEEVADASRAISPQSPVARPVPPAVEAARKALSEAVQVLSAVRQDVLHEAVAKYVNRKYELSDLVLTLDEILENLPDESRATIEDALYHLMPMSQRDKYAEMLRRAKLEGALDAAIENTPLEVHAALAKVVSGTLQRLRGDNRRPDQISSFERRVQLASVQRGYAALSVQAKSESAPFTIEKVAKHVHIGWARAVTESWAPEYGLEPLGELALDQNGALDSFNFSTVQGYQIYLQRLALGNQRFILAEDRLNPEFVEGPRVPDTQKHFYRIAAEMILDCYLKMHPREAGRDVAREDKFAYIELKQLGIIQRGRPASSMTVGSPGSLDLSGRGSMVRTPRNMALPTGPAGGSGDDQVSDDSPPWFHGSIEKSVAADMLAPEPDGTFLIRQRPTFTDFSLDFKFQGRATHHLVSIDEATGVILVGGNVVVADAGSLGELVAGLYQPQQAWPAPLLSFIPRYGVPSQQVVDAQMQLTKTRIAMQTPAGSSVGGSVAGGSISGAVGGGSVAGASSVGGGSAAGASSVGDGEIDWGNATGVVQNIKEFDVEITKGDGPLGLSLVGKANEQDPRDGIFVSKIKPGSTAELNGQIAPGLRVLAVNGVSMITASKPDAVKLLKVTVGTSMNITFKNDRGGWKQFQLMTAASAGSSSGGGSDIYGVVQPLTESRRDSMKVKKTPAAAQAGSPSGPGVAGPNVWLTTLDRAAATAVVTGQPDGTFVLRPSSNASSGYVCTWCYQGAITNSKIEKDDDVGFSISKGSDVFDTLEELATAAQTRVVHPLPTMLRAVGAPIYEAPVDKPVTPTLKVSIVKPADAGYGLSLLSNGEGTFVTALKPGGAADAALRAAQMRIEDGLRFKSVNGVDVLNEPKAGVVAQMKGVARVDLEFIKDPVGYAKVPASPQKASTTPAPVPASAAGDSSSQQYYDTTADAGNGGYTITVPNGKKCGMTLYSSTCGTFVMKMKKTGATYKGLEDAGFSPDDLVNVGLRIVSINGTSTLDSSKAECQAQLKQAAESGATIVFAEDNSGYKKTEADRQAAEADVEPAAAPESAPATPAAAPKSSGTGPITEADIGIRVNVGGYDVPGTLRFVGVHAVSGEPRCGVELDEPVGKNNGTIKGNFYFAAGANYGVLVKPAKVTREGQPIARSAKKPSVNRAAANNNVVKVTIVKPASGGFGLTLASGTQGTFVSAIKPGGAGEAALDNCTPRAKVTDGLRFKSINGVNVLNELKTGVIPHMKGVDKVELVFKKDPTGYASLPASKQASATSGTGAASGPVLAADEALVTIVKPADGGFGMSLGSGAQGAYVTKTKAGGAAEAAFKSCRPGLAVSDGLRFKSINGVDVFNEAKPGVVSHMKGADKVVVIFKKDPAGFARMPAAGAGSVKSPAAAAPAPAAAPSGSSQFDTMGRLAVIKHLRGAGIDYTQAKNVDELRALAKANVGGGSGGGGGGGAQPTYDTPSYNAKADTPASSGGSEFDTMGRLAVIKHLRKLGIDYSTATNVDELRALAKASGGGGGAGGAPGASSGKQKWQTELARDAAASLLTAAAVPGGFLTRPSPRSTSGMVLCTWQANKVMNLQINKDESTGKLSLKSCPFQATTINEFIAYFQGNTGGVLPARLVLLPQFQ